MPRQERKLAQFLSILGLMVGLSSFPSQPLEAQEADLTATVLLLSDAPRMLREACPKLAGAGSDCRIEKVTVTQDGNDLTGRAEAMIYHADGRETPMIMTARLDPVNCELVDRKVEPDAAAGRRLLTMTERQLRLAASNPGNRVRMCTISQSLLGSVSLPSCLCG